MIQHTNEFLKHFEPLFKEIKDFTYFQHFIHNELSKAYYVTGINATAPSLARKTDTIERINEKIAARKAPLEIVDTVPHSTLFQIKLKK